MDIYFSIPFKQLLKLEEIADMGAN